MCCPNQVRNMCAVKGHAEDICSYNMTVLGARTVAATRMIDWRRLTARTGKLSCAMPGTLSDVLSDKPIEGCRRELPW